MLLYVCLCVTRSHLIINEKPGQCSFADTKLHYHNTLCDLILSETYVMQRSWTSLLYEEVMKGITDSNLPAIMPHYRFWPWPTSFIEVPLRDGHNGLYVCAKKEIKMYEIMPT